MFPPLQPIKLSHASPVQVLRVRGLDVSRPLWNVAWQGRKKADECVDMNRVSLDSSPTSLYQTPNGTRTTRKPSRCTRGNGLIADVVQDGEHVRISWCRDFFNSHPLTHPTVALPHPPTAPTDKCRPSAQVIQWAAK